MKAKPKKKSSRAAKKSSKPKAKKAKRAVAAKRRAVANPKRARAAAKPKRSAAKPKRKAAAKPKAAAKARAPKKSPKAKPVAPATKRRDATGHLPPQYASELRAMSQENAEAKDEASFIKGAKSPDPLAEEMGEEYMKSALSGEETGEEALDQVVPEERGGPFIETTGGQEFAEGTDASNPKGSKAEPFPRT